MIDKLLNYRSVRCLDLHLVTNKDAELSSNRYRMQEMLSVLMSSYDPVSPLNLEIEYIHGSYYYMVRWKKPERLN